MLAFRSIRSISGYGVFADYRPDQESLPDFSERNLMYGWNYSGKTTLSRVFRSFEVGKPHRDFTSATFVLELTDGKTASNRELGELPFSVRVFNSDYVRENLRWEDGVTPILILGEENIALQDELNRIRNWLGRRRAYVATLRERREKLRSGLDEAATRTARQVREELGRTPFNRSPHLQEVIDCLGMDYQARILSEEKRNTELKRVNAERRGKVDEITKARDPGNLEKEIADCLEATPKRDALRRLEGKPKVEKWVRDGLALHEEEETCLFCTRALPEELLSSLKGHFSQELMALLSRIENQKARLELARPQLGFRPSVELYPDLQNTYKSNVEQCKDLERQMIDKLDHIRDLLDRKSAQALEVIATPNCPTSEDWRRLNESIAAVNRVISKHNERSKNHESEREESERRLIEDRAATYLQDQEYYDVLERCETLRKREQRWSETISRLERREQDIESKIAEEARGARVINEHLKQYFGADQIVVRLTEAGSYELRRREGSVARNLSEGEKTAIAFAYFLVSLRDHSMVEAQPVVYVDDPVSSLDANHLFNTFAMIKSTMSHCRQLFISTHNYGFFRLMKGDTFFSESVNRRKRASWYLVRRRGSDDSELVDLPKVLRKYNSEYHYLFHLAYIFNQNPERHENLLGLMPNILRRLLETYSSFRVPNTAMNLYQRLERLTRDEVTCSRIYKFVNHGSHSDSLGATVEFPQLSECRAIVREVFRMIESVDAEHYNGMVAISG